MNSVSDIYDNSLHIFTFNEDKKNFRDMLLENPYLYFTNLSIKTSVSTRYKFESDKRHIVIVDFNVLSELDKLTSLRKDNVQLIVLYNTYNSSVYDIYKQLGEDSILINKKDRLKILQKTFYNKVVKHLAPFEDYINVINDEDLDVKNLVIKNGELRYY